MIMNQNKHEAKEHKNLMKFTHILTHTDTHQHTDSLIRLLFLILMFYCTRLELCCLRQHRAVLTAPYPREASLIGLLECSLGFWLQAWATTQEICNKQLWESLYPQNYIWLVAFTCSLLRHENCLGQTEGDSVKELVTSTGQASERQLAALVALWGYWYNL